MCEQNSSHFTCLTLSSSKQGQFSFIRQKDSVLWSQMRPALEKCICHSILGRSNQGSGRALLASSPQHTQTHTHIHCHPHPLLRFTNTYLHSRYSPLPSHATYLYLPIPTDNILVHLCPFILLNYTSTHPLPHTLHTLLTIPPPTPPALSPPTTHPHLCQSPPY